jgi:L-2-hydroxyglutarate oxidase
VEGVERVGDGVSITTHEETLEASFLVNAAGLYADRLARMTGFDPPCRIVPFRGEYYTLAPRARGLVNGLVYPVPDPDLPFLGVHVTPHIDGSVEVGPNAVLALAREGYRKTDVDARDLMGTLLYPGFLRMARRYWRTSLHEMRRSLSTRVFAEDLRRLVPRLGVADMAPGGAGVRAQAIGRGGELIDDFLLVDRPHALHILNAPSPAATSSLAIAEHVVGRIPALSA